MSKINIISQPDSSDDHYTLPDIGSVTPSAVMVTIEPFLPGASRRSRGAGSRSKHSASLAPRKVTQSLCMVMPGVRVLLVLWGEDRQSLKDGNI